MSKIVLLLFEVPLADGKLRNLGQNFLTVQASSLGRLSVIWKPTPRRSSSLRFGGWQEQLGHSSVKLTVDTYCHRMPGRNREAMDRLPSFAD